MEIVDSDKIVSIVMPHETIILLSVIMQAIISLPEIRISLSDITSSQISEILLRTSSISETGSMEIMVVSVSV